MKRKVPFIVAISGVGGAGKNSVLEVFKKYPQKFSFFVSYTDRPQREDDIPGETYHFITKEEFSKSIENGEFIEWEQVRGEYRYGRKKQDFDKILDSGRIPVMNIDVLGAKKFKKIYGLLSFFIIPPSVEEAARRMKQRGTDTPEAIRHRMERYDLEMSYKDKYDYVIVNDDLQRARNEVLEIIKKEIRKRTKSRVISHLGLFLILTSAICFGSLQLYKSEKNQLLRKEVSQAQTLQEDKKVEAPTGEKPETDQTAVKALPSKEIRKKIAASPPKYSDPGSLKIGTKKNSDGTTTTTISTGGSSGADDLARASTITSTINTPYGVSFRDETGLHGDLDQILKDYLNGLKWKNEISSMKEITIRNAGNTGWSGQYLGQYAISANGQDIISATGAIVLNSYYFNDPSIFNDIMKLILSHEYGHHYTLYHKWVDWDIPAGIRFPDSYYSLRPLSKATTAPDYSLGWPNADVEIIAEDYSYFYSGFSLHAMSSTYGFPSAGIGAWLANIGDPALKENVVNNPPTLSITAPSASAVISGATPFQVTAGDDLAVEKVSFYIGSTLIGEDTAAPYEATINSSSFANGDYTLKAIASDGALTAEKTISVRFENETVDLEKPAVSITNPATSPHTLTHPSLDISVVASDNVSIDRIEFYFEGTLQDSWETGNLNLSASFASLSPGTYTLLFKAFDTAGNFSEATLTIIKP